MSLPVVRFEYWKENELVQLRADRRRVLLPRTQAAGPRTRGYSLRCWPRLSRIRSACETNERFVLFFFFVFTCAVDGPWTFWQERLRPEIKWGIIGRVCFLGGCTRHDWFLLPWCVRNGTFLNGTKCRRLGQLVTSATGSGRGQIGLGHASCDVRSD